MPWIDGKGKTFRRPYTTEVAFLWFASLPIMIWGAGGIVVAILHNFVADSPPYLDYDWAEVMGRSILIFGVGCFIFGVAAVLDGIAFIAKTMDYIAYEKDSE